MSFPPQTNDDFFDKNVRQSIINFFNLPASKVKIAFAVSADSRKRRSTDNVEVIIEISNDPEDSDASMISSDKMKNISATVMDKTQCGEALVEGGTVLSVSEPLPSPEDSNWQDVVEKVESGEEFTTVIQIPANLHITEGSKISSEGTPLQNPFTLHMTTADNEHVKQLGSIETPWQVTAKLIVTESHNQNAKLVGEATESFKLGGYANFTGLAISHAGTYEIQFSISSSAKAVENFGDQVKTVSSIVITKKQVTSRISDQPESAVINEKFTISTELYDTQYNERVEHIDWKDHEWDCALSLYPDYDAYPYDTTISGDTSITMNAETGYGVFEVSVNKVDTYVFSVTCESTPEDYSFTFMADSIVISDPNQKPNPDAVKKAIKFKYGNAKYANVKDEPEKFCKVVVSAMRKYLGTIEASKTMVIEDCMISSGSVIVELTMEASDEKDMKSLLESLSDGLSKNSLNIVYDGVNYQTAGDLEVDGDIYVQEKSGGTAGWKVALIVIFVLIIIAVCIGIAYYLLVHKKKMEKGSSQRIENPTDEQLYGGPKTRTEAGDVTPRVPSRNASPAQMAFNNKVYASDMI